VSPAGAGSGTVTSAPSGINCGATCAADYLSGIVVALTATPQAGSAFAGWSGDCTGTGACNVTMSAARNVTATFVPMFALSVSKAGVGTGTVSSTPAGIACGATCAASFASGALVGLTATPTAGSGFAGWSGACTGTGACNVTMDAAKSVTATFTAVLNLAVVKQGTGSGTVTSFPAGIACGATCSADFAPGTQVSL